MEISQESWKISRKVGELIGKGGAGLYIDYGGPQMFGNSFRVRPVSSLPFPHHYHFPRVEKRRMRRVR